MKFKRLTSAAGADFEPAFDLYGVSFPIHEQRLIESQRSIMTHPEYLFDLIYDDSGEWCGDMLYWETADFVCVEHFCILPDSGADSAAASARWSSSAARTRP
ncbi:MAG: hypothetical protein V8S72_02360 [Oscillospiraceae bacterium]